VYIILTLATVALQVILIMEASSVPAALLDLASSVPAALLDLVKQDLANIPNPVATQTIYFYESQILPAASSQEITQLRIPVPRLGDCIQQFVLNIDGMLDSKIITSANLLTYPNYHQSSTKKITQLAIGNSNSTSIRLTSSWEHSLINADMLELEVNLLLAGITRSIKIRCAGVFIYLSTEQRRAKFI
jgi:hypothetical protein